MMEISTVIILTILILINWYRKKYLLNPVTVFSGIWVVEVILANFRMYGMIEYSEKALLIILLGNIAFFIGSYPKKRLRFKVGTSAKKDCEVLYFNIPTLYACILIAAVCAFVVAASVIGSLAKGQNYAYVRDMLFGYDTSDTLVQSGLFMLFFTWGVTGIIYAIMPIALVALFEGKSKRRGVVFASLLIAIIYSFATAGRATLFVLGIQLVVLIFHYRVVITRKQKRIIFCILAALVSFLVVVSILRRGAGNINSFYTYFCMSVPLLSHWIDFIDTHNYRTYGLATLYGVIALIANTFGKFVTIPGYDALNEIVNAPQNEWVWIFRDPLTHYNAFCSLFYYLYLDFGFAGVFFLSLIFGFAANDIFCSITRDKKSLVEYLFVIQMLALSFMKLQIANPPYIIAWIIIELSVVRRNKIK